MSQFMNDSPYLFTILCVFFLAFIVGMFRGNKSINVEPATLNREHVESKIQDVRNRIKTILQEETDLDPIVSDSLAIKIIKALSETV